jgi:hypothetical protein
VPMNSELQISLNGPWATKSDNPKVTKEMDSTLPWIPFCIFFHGVSLFSYESHITFKLLIYSSQIQLFDMKD